MARTALTRSSVVRPEFVARLARATAALALVAWGALVFLAADPIYRVEALLASIVTFGALLGFLLWRPPPGRESFRLAGVLVALQAFLGAGAPVLVAPTSLGLRPTPEAFTFAVIACTLFSSAFLVGVWLVSGGIRPPRPLVSTSGPMPTVALFLAMSTAGVALINGVRPTLALGILPLIVFNMSLLIPLFTAHYLLRGTGKFVLALLLGVQVAVSFSSSMLGVAAFALRDVWLTHSLLGKRFPWTLGAAAIMAFVVVNPAKHLFRQAVSETSGPIDYSEAAALWSTAVEETWLPSAGRSESGREEAFKATTSRVDQNGLAAHVYSMVPARRPFAGGRTYEDIPLILIPRVLYPDKPTSQGYLRTRWTVEIGIQHSQTLNETAYSIPAYAEAYWNFGWLGVVSVPLLFGIFVGLILRINVPDPVARAGWTVLVVTYCTVFVDMMIWVFPLALIAIASAPLVSFYTGLGRYKMKKSPTKLGEHEARGRTEPPERFSMNAKRTG
jgi:hypothetical protein